MTSTEERHQRNLKWREKYEAGKTLQQIADEEEGTFYLSTISKAIRRAGGTIRPPGYVKGQKNKNKPKKGLVAWAVDISPKKESSGLLGWINN